MKFEIVQFEEDRYVAHVKFLIFPDGTEIFLIESDDFYHVTPDVKNAAYKLAQLLSKKTPTLEKHEEIANAMYQSGLEGRDIEWSLQYSFDTLDRISLLPIHEIESSHKLISHFLRDLREFRKELYLEAVRDLCDRLSQRSLYHKHLSDRIKRLRIRFFGRNTHFDASVGEV